MQKRLISLILIGFLTIFIATAAFAQQPAAGKVIKWRFQSHWPAGSASFKPLKDFFDQKLTKLTDGRLQITLYPEGAMPSCSPCKLSFLSWDASWTRRGSS
jgi:TRAP-type mannitol/chloroaromatic compound transport system substrate-binding protein